MSREPDRNNEENRSPQSDFDIRVKGIPIKDTAADLLNTTRAAVIIDGLDEIEYTQRETIEREIEGLNYRLTDSKILLSCRSGDYNTNFHGFRVFEILSLNEVEIERISRIWLEDPAPFLRSLQETPYSDIVNRPLLLSFLLYLYSSDGELPEQPSLIYRKVVYRLLKEWDEERRIKRASKYAHFDPDRKIDFLSELAYYLTYEIKGKVFTEKIFIAAYSHICQSFNLPSDEYKRVVSEVETHTGIIISSGIGTFEFAHLSIQEFLCANYISRSPYPDLLKRYLSEYPAPVAVACALSSNPSMFFVEMVNRHLTEKFKNPHDSLHGEPDLRQLSLDFFGTNTAPALKSFLSRLKSENPYFKVDQRFGECILCLFAFYYRRYDSDADDLLIGLVEMPGTRDSLRHAISHLKKFKPRLLTQSNVVFDMDMWFRSIYENVAGPWQSLRDKEKVLPLVLFPRDILEEVWQGKVNMISQDIKPRLRTTLSPTPFCLIENGEHELDERRVCAICGFESKHPYRHRRC